MRAKTHVLRDHTVTSWLDLCRLVELADRKRWLFRGESRCGRELRPTVGRISDAPGAARKVAFDPAHELAVLRLFQRQARPYLTHTPDNDTEWLAISQHHGLPTRLLDWSESLFVAAYFAVTHAGTKGPAVIYVNRDIPEMSSQQEREPFAIRKVLLYRPPHISPRIPAQSSVFTVHPNPSLDLTWERVARWTIDATACGGIKRALDGCGINESTLSPGLDGLARHLGWLYKWGKL